MVSWFLNSLVGLSQTNSGPAQTNKTLRMFCTFADVALATWNCPEQRRLKVDCQCPSKTKQKRLEGLSIQSIHWPMQYLNSDSGTGDILVYSPALIPSAKTQCSSEALLQASPCSRMPLDLWSQNYQGVRGGIDPVQCSGLRCDPCSSPWGCSHNPVQKDVVTEQWADDAGHTSQLEQKRNGTGNFDPKWSSTSTICSQMWRKEDADVARNWLRGTGPTLNRSPSPIHWILCGKGS